MLHLESNSFLKWSWSGHFFWVRRFYSVYSVYLWWMHLWRTEAGFSQTISGNRVYEIWIHECCLLLCINNQGLLMIRTWLLNVWIIDRFPISTVCKTFISAGSYITYLYQLMHKTTRTKVSVMLWKKRFSVLFFHPLKWGLTLNTTPIKLFSKKSSQYSFFNWDQSVMTYVWK